MRTSNITYLVRGTVATDFVDFPCRRNTIEFARKEIQKFKSLDAQIDDEGWIYQIIERTTTTTERVVE